MLLKLFTMFGDAGFALNFEDLDVTNSGSPAAYAGFRINRDGTTDERDDAGYYQVNHSTDWIESAGQAADVGDDYEMKVVKISGTSLTGIADDTWLALSSAREGYITSAVTHKEYSGTLYVREVADTSNVVSGAVTLSVL